MDKFSSMCILAALTLLCMSCATNSLKIVTPPDPGIQTDTGLHRLFLIGDGGEDTEIFRMNMRLLTHRLQASDIPATLVYLGDNVYPRGIPEREGSSGYTKAVDIINAQIDGVDGLTHQTIFIPGNHDWNKGHPGGLKAIRKQGNLIDASGKARMLPRRGCGGPEVVELTEDVVMIILDSQWWLHDWRTESDINSRCEIRTREDLIIAFTELLRDYQEQRVIVALHHPLFSGGSHSGFLTLREHIFPFTTMKNMRNFYLPLPVLGSIHPIYRGNFGNVQDIAHHKYHALKTSLLEAARFYENVVFVAGHEHALEYHRSENHHFLVSGAGSRLSPLGKPSTMEYGHGVPGFMQLNLKENGAVDLLIWESQHPDKPAYQRALTPRVTPIIDTSTFVDLSGFPETMDIAISQEYDKGGFHRFIFGERYRNLYKIPVPARVLDLSEERGGLTPVKKGGGMQTNSLRLTSEADRELTARSMSKDASKLLPEVLQNTFASDIVQDQFTASHPYGAFVIPGLADVAGVYHTNPELVYIPKQEALGRYAASFGDQLYLLEERPSEEWSKEPFFGGCDDIVSSGEVVEESMDDYRNEVDQALVARSRLFDMFLGDWDRHDDQWRWAECDKDGKGKIYRPIPRDRDQVFANYDGLLVGLGKIVTPTIRKLNRFRPEVENQKWFNDNGKIFDHDFLNELPREEWLRIAEELKNTITDRDIEENIGRLSPEIYAEGGDEIVSILKARRDLLPEYASTYYDILSETIFIRGTNNADFIEITESPAQVRIRLFDSNKEGDRNEMYYERTFVKSVTKEIQIYGLQGHDRIEIDGPGSGGMRIFVIGGEDEDKVQVSEGRHRAIRIQDTEEKAAIVGDQSVKYRQVGDEENTYERNAFLYDYTIPKFLIAGNPDDGFLVGAGAEWVNHGFQKYPYASKHLVEGFFAFATSAYGITYKGNWIDAIGNLDVGLHAQYDGPTFVQNYFGFGNESEEIESEDMDYYRVRKQGYAIIPSIRAGREQGSSIGLHAGLENHEVEETSGRFVSDPESGLSPDVFTNLQFAVTGVTLQYKIVDHFMLTRRGVDFDLAAGLEFPLQGDDKAHRYLRSSLALYYQFPHLGRPVLATRVGMEWHGGDYQFYQAAILGAQGNFRGMRKERLTGERAFYHNTDLRIMLTRWRGYYLPAALGIQLNFDHGRVWADGEDSDTWHYAYGGGVWISPLETLLLSVNYHVSDIDQRFSVAMGFLF